MGLFSRLFGRSTGSGAPSSGGFVSVEWIPPSAVMAATFALMGDNISHTEDLLTELVQDVAAPEFLQNFEVGGRPPWPELSYETMSRKEYSGSMNTEAILIDTELLMEAAGSPDSWDISPREAQFVRYPEYGAFHQEGTTYMPQRLWATLPPEAENEVDARTAEWVDKALG